MAANSPKSAPAPTPAPKTGPVLDTISSLGRDDASAPPGEATRLVNPAIREYMDTLSLQRFYGGYVVAPLPEEILNLGIGEVGSIDLPVSLYDLYQQFIATHDLEGQSTRYGGTLGHPDTNALMADWVNGWLGEKRFTSETIVSFDGGQNGMEVAIRTFTTPLGTGRGRPYVMLAVPSYPYFSMIVAAQAGIHAVLAYTADQLTENIERYCHSGVGLILINVPQNPMGYMLTAEHVERINRVARAYDCAIAVDMVYASFAPTGAGRALAGLDPGRTVFIDSFSKKFGLPGFRMGFALSARPELTYAMRFIKTAESLSPSSPKLAFCGWLLRERPGYPALIAKTVQERCERFLEVFGAEKPPGVTFLGERSNPFYLGVNIGELVAHTGLNDLQIQGYLQAKHKVRTYPGSFVYPSTALKAQELAGSGKPGSNGTRFAPPGVPSAPIVYAPELTQARTPMLRLSFGSEPRVEPAARALAGAFRALWNGERP